MNTKRILIAILLLIGLTLSGCFLPPPLPWGMVAAVVMDTRAILMATGMETVVTGIVVTVVQGVIGDEIKEQGESLSLIVAFPLQWRHTNPIVPP